MRNHLRKRELEEEMNAIHTFYDTLADNRRNHMKVTNTVLRINISQQKSTKQWQNYTSISTTDKKINNRSKITILKYNRK